MAAETTRYNVLQAAVAAVRTKVDGTGKYWNNLNTDQVTTKVETTEDRTVKGYALWIGVYIAAETPDTVEITQRQWMRHLGIEVLVITVDDGTETTHERAVGDVVNAMLEDGDLNGTCDKIHLETVDAPAVGVGNDSDRPETMTVLTFLVEYEHQAGTSY